MGCDIIRAEFFRQMVRNSLRQPPGIDENQRGTMLFNQFHEAGVNLFPHFVGGNGTELAGRDFDRQIESALVADVDNDRIRTAISSQEMSDLFNRLLCGRQANAHWRVMR